MTQRYVYPVSLNELATKHVEPDVMQILGVVPSDLNDQPFVSDLGFRSFKRLVADSSGRKNRGLSRAGFKGSRWLDSNSGQPHLLEVNKDPISEEMPATYHYKAGSHKVRVFLLDTGVNLNHEVRQNSL